MRYRIGIDVGGTFTDFLLVDEHGHASIYKALTTPQDPSEGLISGLELIAASNSFTLDNFLRQVSVIVHGTTITTNAVLTGQEPKRGLSQQKDSGIR